MSTIPSAACAHDHTQPQQQPAPCASRHDASLGSHDFRSDFESFRRMGSNKPVIVQRLLERRAAAAAVVLSDVDTVWLRDPSAFIARHRSADMFISTDCLSHWVEQRVAAAAEPPAHFHRCGHLPGATFGRAFNTGVSIFRNRSALVHRPHFTPCTEAQLWPSVTSP